MQTTHTAPFGPNHRILIIDDNPSIHADFHKILCASEPHSETITNLEAVLFDGPAEATGPVPTFELESATQGQEGLELVKKSLAEDLPFAMAFVDVRMPPGWDGIETVARIWETYPQLQVVICTAYSDYSWKEMRARLTQTDSLVILKKPFDNVEVQQLAHAMTKKWLLNQQASHRLTIAERSQGELRAANELLSRSEERFSRAFSASPVPIAIQALADQRFVNVNDRFVNTTGYHAVDLLGCTAREINLWENPGAIDEWLQTLGNGIAVRDRQTKLRCKSGELRDVLVSLERVDLAGEPHLLLLTQDITERMQLQRRLVQSQKMEAVGQLAAGVAHDFNNILTVIQGHSGLLNHLLGKNGPHTKSIEQISSATNRAAKLIRQLLMFSRKQVMRFRPLNLNEVIENMSLMLRRLIGEHISFEFQSQAGLSPVLADDGMVEQILMNLAVNARDAMPQGGQLVIRTELREIHREASAADPEPRQGNFVCLSVTDTGCGMDTSILQRIFEPFFTTKEVGKGTGIGLATVYGIVKQHQGWIEVESAPGRGSTFRIFFPVSAQPIQTTVSPATEFTVRRGSETILIAEDEETLRDLVAQVLGVQGYTVLSARSGREALQIFETSEQKISLLLTDLVMPEGILGHDLAERLMRRQPDLRVIFTSGYSPGMAGKELAIVSNTNFLPKPYSVNKLAEVVRNVLDQPSVSN